MEKIISNLRYSAVAGLPLSLLLMLFALPVQAESQKAQAQFYKWTDESGQVHYTQSPPPAQQAEKIQLKTGTSNKKPAVAPPTEKDGVLVCGSLILPKKRLDPVTNIAMFKQARAIWQKYIDENSEKDDEASRQGVSDRRCAIGYAEQELRALSEVEQDINTNYERVTEELEELRQSVKACEDPDTRDEELSVAACKQQYQPRIQQLEIMQRRMVAPEKMQ